MNFSKVNLKKLKINMSFFKIINMQNLKKNIKIVIKKNEKNYAILKFYLERPY